jgi:two-component system, chemotaxis family, chemotaxis protein CheY
MSAKILIVDDSALARRMTRQLLEQLGYAVEEAVDGPEGLERYVINRHDLVLLDMVMHGMYGLDVLAKFREINPKLPVIVVTADIQKSTREAAQAGGAAAVVNKPVDKEELTRVLETVLGGGTVWS